MHIWILARSVVMVNVVYLIDELFFLCLWSRIEERREKLIRGMAIFSVAVVDYDYVWLNRAKKFSLFPHTSLYLLLVSVALRYILFSSLPLIEVKPLPILFRLFFLCRTQHTFSLSLSYILCLVCRVQRSLKYYWTRLQCRLLYISWNVVDSCLMCFFLPSSYAFFAFKCTATMRK